MKIRIALPVIVVFLALISIIIWKHNVLVEDVWNFLVVSEKPQHSDVIIVISGGAERTPYGVELYKEGYAPKLILSGGSSPNMERQAISMGVPKKDIILDTNSGTTLGNGYYSSKIMQAQGFKSAILVTSPYHTRRAGIIFHEFFKGWKLTVCATPYDPSTSTNWWKSKQTAEYVVTEYLKLVYHYVAEIPGQKVVNFLIQHGILSHDPFYKNSIYS